MGLLSDPKTREKFATIVSRYHNPLCLLCYVVGLVWFLLLAHKDINARTYFSENALLPGLVEPDFQHVHGADEFLRDLREEINNRKSNEDTKHRIPSEWIRRRFQEAGLDAYEQNYTFRYPQPILNGQSFTGVNVYGILRAPRAPGTEALVLSAPYRPDAHRDPTLPGIALLYGLAKAFRRHTYWAKDIIFLVTENDEIGMQAWLSAYHHSTNEYISARELPGRSGSIQAALNLEIGTDAVSRMDVRVEGLNGQLPNLDLFNTVVLLCRRENIQPTIQKRTDYWNLDSLDGFKHSLKTMLLMMWRLAPGSPSGNHGLFHRYNVEAVTLHSTKLKNSRQLFGFPEMGRVVEGVVRSLNNLLERFHQSFFFYLLPSTDRYISIGLYMPPFGVLVLPIAIKAIALWLMSGALAPPIPTTSDDEKVSETSDCKTDGEGSTQTGAVGNAGKEKEDKNETSESTDTSKIDSPGKEESPGPDQNKPKSEETKSLNNILSYVPLFLMSWFFGLAGYYGPPLFIASANSLRIPPEEGVAIGALAVHVAALIYPGMIRWKLGRKSGGVGSGPDPRMLKCIALIMLGVLLGTAAIINISLAVFISALWVPVVLLVRPTHSRFLRIFQSLALVAISPLGLAYLAGLVHVSVLGKAGLDMVAAWQAVQDGLAMAYIQAQMYGNWTYALISLVLVPNWSLFWLVLWSDPSQ